VLDVGRCVEFAQRPMLFARRNASMTGRDV
jgi:hypothetical protein